MPKHKRGIIPNQYSLVHSTNISSEQSTPAESKETLNILNGVLNCSWNKTSAIPKLLEIANTSEVKFNIDSDNPLVVAFANGWDDLDRPAQVVKRLAVAPSNIDLSAKANCKVQIVAKVINDELVITTHDIYDPGWEVWTPVITMDSGYVDATPLDATTKWASTKDGWKVSATAAYSSTYLPRRVLNSTTDRWKASTAKARVYIQREDDMAFALSHVYWAIYLPSTWGAGNILAYRKYPDPEGWFSLGFVAKTATDGTIAYKTFVNPYTDWLVSGYGFETDINNNEIQQLYGYEQPTAKFYRGLNKVKDRSDVEQLWINLGYATVDASGNITALTHYTDLRNNYPGGMRVEA